MSDTMTQTKVELKKPSLFNVILHNDDVTPFDYVIFILENIFFKDSLEAIEVTNEIHRSRGGVAGTYTEEIAQQKIIDVETANSLNGYSLKVTMEEE